MAACLAGCYLVLWFQENHCFQADLLDWLVVPEEEIMVPPLLRLLQQWWNDGSQAIVVVVNG